MSVEILVVVWLLLCGLFFANGSYSQFEIVGNREEVRYRQFAATIIILPLILMAGLRSGAGYADTNAYISVYNSMPVNLPDIWAYADRIGKDKAFYLFVGLIKRIFGESYHPFLLIVAIIQGISLRNFYRKYSEYYLLSLTLFVLAGEYLGWMMNGIRQFLAVAIVYLGIDYLIEKKLIKFILIVTIASLFHGTALIMIPIAFVVQGKSWNIRTLGVMGGAIFAIFATSRFTGLMSAMLEDTVYSANLIEMQLQQGTNPLRVAVYCLPAILSFLLRGKIEEENNNVLDIAVNMSIITAAISLIGMATSGIMLGRLPIYTALFSYILLPYELDLLFGRENSRIPKVIMVIFYFLFYYYLMHFAYGKI